VVTKLRHTASYVVPGRQQHY